MWSAVTSGATSFSLLHQTLHLRGVLAIRDQDRVLARDHDEIVHAEQRDERLLRSSIGILCVDEHRIALRGVAVRIVLESSHTACQEPTSDQPQDTGTTAARLVFSITA